MPLICVDIQATTCDNGFTMNIKLIESEGTHEFYSTEACYRFLIHLLDDHIAMFRGDPLNEGIYRESMAFKTRLDNAPPTAGTPGRVTWEELKALEVGLNDECGWDIAVTEEK